MYKRIIIKVGTRVLSKTNGQLNSSVMRALVEQIVELRKSGAEIVLVSSGAVGAGRGLLTQTLAAETIADKQVFAAVGQVKLMERYAAFFKRRGYHTAQVLVTKEDFRDREHYHNMRRCFINLLRDGIIPIVNENDVVAIKELVFTDNDELAGLVAAQLDADAVVLLTSTDGVLDRSPSDPDAVTIHEITSADLSLYQRNITNEKTNVGRGGMRTKFSVAKKLMASGIAVHIALGTEPHVLREIYQGRAAGTRFVPARKTSGIKRRLAHQGGLCRGVLVVNPCAAQLLMAKDRALSLLPIGIVACEGVFEKGDVVEIRDEKKKRIGFGMSAYDAEKVREVQGKHGARAVVHYDNLFIE